MNNIKIHIKKYLNKKIILILHIFLFILLIIYSSNKNCNNFELIEGNPYIADNTSIWQFKKNIRYNNDFITDFFDLKYTYISNTTKNGYPILEGYIELYDKSKDEKEGIFKEFLFPEYEDNFIYNFKNNIEMNKEIYDIDIKNNKLRIMYLNNCSNNTCLYEKDNICFLKENIYNDINSFLVFYFEEKIKLPEYCYSNINKNVIQLLYFILKFIFLIILFNIFILLFSSIIKHIRIYKKRSVDGYIPLN